jgi:Wiskott-Aldrich syndrome protein
MFRASPWINYEPGGDNRNLALPPDHHPAHYNPAARLHYNMVNGDVDMGTPQISTLRDEETPPPQPLSTRGKFRVNLLVGEKNGVGRASGSGSRKPEAESEEEEEEQDELEEDQLIDDDDDGIQLKRPLSVTLPPVKPKPSPKKRARKSDKPEPKTELSHGDVWDPQHNAAISDSLSAKAAPKKKPAPKKPAVPGKPKIKAAPKVAKSLAIPHLEDAGALSETYTGTAASSPAPHDANSPEPDLLAPSDINLDGIALPIYPLPSKPFPVQPPPKIGTGLAPVIPLDKSTNKPRRWRTANREIRGIAGGRWFARSWVGDKESELATAAVNAAAAAAIIKANYETDKRAALGSTPAGASEPTSGSMPPVAPAKALAKPKVLKGQPGTSVSNSRAPSIASDVAAHAPRPPTKMRTMLAGPASEAGNDSDMAAPGP